MTFSTPSVPDQAIREKKAWENRYKRPALISVFEQQQHARFCKNCAGMGAVYITFCEAGPSDVVYSGKKPSTYFEGNGRFGKGWYLIGDTQAYKCGMCDGTGNNPDYQRGPLVKKSMDELLDLAASKRA